jgi:hypothetical protein
MQECFLKLLVILSILKLGSSITTTFNVLHYGAVGDGKTNDSPVK